MLWKIAAGLIALLLCGAARAEQGALAPGRPVLAEQDPAVLAELEAIGASLGTVLGAPALSSTRDLAAGSPAMRAIASHLAEDVAELRADMRAHGRSLDESRPGEVGGAFDPRWLTSPFARFELAAVMNRLDRQDFAAAEGRATCGEVRLIYRLAYRFERPDGSIVASRLPFTLNAVHDVPRPEQGDCRAVARRWITPHSRAGARDQARFLAEGPLAPGSMRLRQLEINAQLVRLPSGAEPGFGGQAVYLLRVFGIERAGEALTAVARPLENTPDLARLKADAGLRRDLVAFLRGQLPAIDQGVYALPERFAATKALAYSTFGSARLGNRPFGALLSAEDFAGLDLDGLAFARSPQALIERLDNTTCQGCHQAGATAGFHLLGRDRAESSSYNRLAEGGSPHLAADLPRRAAYLEAVLAGAAPNRFRPLSTAPPADWRGAHPAYAPAATAMACLPEAARALVGESWGCGAGETCTVIADNPHLPVPFGQCMPERATAGLACRAGRIETSAVAPYNDRMSGAKTINSFARRASATDYTCRPPRIGVPGGLAYRQCDTDDRAFAGFAEPAGGVPAEICGLTGGKAFDKCVASKDVARCLQAATARGNRPTCGRDRHCREDYVCQALPDEADPQDRVPADIGFCSPTYFVFQMRLDGHPDPIRGLASR